jgi:bacillithiol system protein YtxJ
MGWFSKTAGSGKGIDWKQLTSLEQLETWNDLSFQKPVVFFKHSTRCSISSMAKSRFERGWDYEDDEIIPVYLDLLQFREISNELEAFYNVPHQSPQVLLVKNGKCIFNTSHSQISAEDLAAYIA